MKKVWAVLRTASWILFALAAAWGVSLLRLSGEAGTVMSSGPVTVPAAEDTGAAARLMAARRVCRLPVTEDGRLVGMLSQGDILD